MGLPVSRRFHVVFTIAWLCLAVAAFSMMLQMAFKIDVYVLRRVTGALMFVGIIGLFGSVLVAVAAGWFNAAPGMPAPVEPVPSRQEQRGFEVAMDPSAAPAPIFEPPPPSPLARLSLSMDRRDPRWRIRMLLVPPIMLAYLVADYLMIRYMPPNPFFAHVFLLMGGTITAAVTGLFRSGRLVSGLVGGMTMGLGASFGIWLLSGKALPELLRGEFLNAARSLSMSFVPILILVAVSYVTTVLFLPERGEGDRTP